MAYDEEYDNWCDQQNAELEAEMFEWFERVINVVCDECTINARGTADELNRRFWTIGRETLCPLHAAKQVMRRAA
jgi:hypothetical protein